MDKIQNPLTLRWIHRDGRVHRYLQRTGHLPQEPPLQAHLPANVTSAPVGACGPSHVHHVTDEPLHMLIDKTAPQNRVHGTPKSLAPASSLPLLDTESTLPRRMIPFRSRDKGFHEFWYPRRDLLDIPHPFRMVLLAKPNGGNTTLILNIILRIAEGPQPFRRIIIIHCDPDATCEYDDVEHVSLTSIPGADFFDARVKTLAMLEDVNYLDMCTEQRGKLERLFGYVHTHKNVSVILTAQDSFHLIPSVRLCANVFVMWNNHDGDMIKRLARKCGMTPTKLVQLFEEHCQGTHDCIWMDFTAGSPAPIRKNGFQRLSM